MPIMIVVLCCLAIAYRFYSAFLAAKVLALDDSRVTPAHRLNDGQNYHPTHKWVLFGHHFAAISGAGPLIGPVLAVQFGYLPGLIWIVIGVCLAGAVQDMLVLGASVRRNGRSLAEIAKAEIGNVAGGTASVAILFVVIIALSGLGVVVVKTLGGEEIKLAAGTGISWTASVKAHEVMDDTTTEAKASTFSIETIDDHDILHIPPNSTVHYPNNQSVNRSEGYTLVRPHKYDETKYPSQATAESGNISLPEGTTQQVTGSSWGTFTIACTIPIALFVGWYMYRFRKGHVVEASLIGAVAVLAATVAGNLIPGSWLEPYFSLSRGATIWAICIYGFVASVLPVWLLLCPRDYLSSFLKIGTVALLVGAVIIANPVLQAPQVNEVFANGGPTVPGAIFPFCFICIMCGAISGFHSLVSSGTTPKMIGKESEIRMIGYGAMLIEGLVGVVALIAAASLNNSDYYALNIDQTKVQNYTKELGLLDATHDNLAEIEKNVGGESLRGRTGGAVTLAVGMSNIFSEATRRVAGDRVDINGVIKYWFHFAIMFEALFILTTIDTGTRIARFLLQEFLGKFNKKFDRTDWLPGSVISTGIVVAAWGGMIASGSIDTIWPMFGIANQLLAVIALTIVTTMLFNMGRGRYVWVTIPPIMFVIATTMTAGYQMVSGRFWDGLVNGWNAKDAAGSAVHDWPAVIKNGLNIFFILFMVGSVLIILWEAIQRWLVRTPERTSATTNPV